MIALFSDMDVSNSRGELVDGIERQPFNGRDFRVGTRGKPADVRFDSSVGNTRRRLGKRNRVSAVKLCETSGRGVAHPTDGTLSTQKVSITLPFRNAVHELWIAHEK